MKNGPAMYRVNTLNTRPSTQLASSAVDDLLTAVFICSLKYGNCSVTFSMYVLEPVYCDTGQLELL